MENKEFNVRKGVKYDGVNNFVNSVFDKEFNENLILSEYLFQIYIAIYLVL